MANPSRQYQQISDEEVIITCKSGKCYDVKGSPWFNKALNSMTEAQLAELDLRVYQPPTPEPYVYTYEDRLNQLDQKCREVVDELHWSSGPMVYDKAMQGKPKSKLLNDWVDACWTQFAYNASLIHPDAFGLDAWEDSMLDYPPKPCSVFEAKAE